MQSPWAWTAVHLFQRCCRAGKLCSLTRLFAKHMSGC